MSIHFNFVEIDEFSLQRRNIKNWIKNCAVNEKRKLGDIQYIFCSDPYLLKINKKFLNHDYLTDIVTFDYDKNDIISGDVFISIDRIKENSAIYKVSFYNELLRVIIHGILHLIGYNDKSDSEKKIMREKENYYLSLYSDKG